MTGQPSPLLGASGVCFTYRTNSRDRQVLHDVSIEVRAGELHSVIGRSGVGKSTLLRVLSGELRPEGGAVHRPASAEARMISLYQPQEAMLLPWRSVAQNVRLGLDFTGKRPTLDPDVLLASFGLSNHLQRHPATLSGGQMERAALARTLLTPALVYLLDEPLSGTDYPLRLELEVFLVNFLVEQASGAVVVTHDVPQAVAISHRVLLLADATDGAVAQSIDIPNELGPLDPVARRAHPHFGEFVQHLVERMGRRR